MRKKPLRYSDLPGWPALLGADLAAAYLGLNPADFDRLARRLELPPPKLLAGEQRWPRAALDAWISGEDAPGPTGTDRIANAIARMAV
ncbi:hypothetical protein U5903_03435 [Cereibacter johrii]|uniref:hypothetical protein n=1 Tax=Cereibacter johrii TaxID=445629 RepID=UPI002B261972|nr:hypothetical protein [Cereibacter johrii]MEA5159819.1 hypothetical protein [Cereibacter johrii]